MFDLIDCLHLWQGINPVAHRARSNTDEGLVAKMSVCALSHTAMKIRKINCILSTFGKIVAPAPTKCFPKTTA